MLNRPQPAQTAQGLSPASPEPLGLDPSAALHPPAGHPPPICAQWKCLQAALHGRPSEVISPAVTQAVRSYAVTDGLSLHTGALRSLHYLSLARVVHGLATQLVRATLLHFAVGGRTHLRASRDGVKGVRVLIAAETEDCRLVSVDLWPVWVVHI